jgi:hypothetical protein
MAVIVRKAKRKPAGPEPAYAALHRVADRKVASMARAIVDAMHGLRDKFSEDEWVYALGHGTWGELLARMDQVSFRKAIDPSELEPLTGTILDIATGAAKASVTWQSLTGPQQSVLLTSMSVVNPQAVAWASQYAGSLVSGIIDQNVLAIRQIISNAMRNGGAPVDTAKLIQHTIGLNARQVTAVGNYRAGLVEAGVKPDRIEALVRRKAEQSLKSRALTISRTETMSAANMGQQRLWGEMMRAGYLEPGSRKVFIVTHDDRLCEECASYDGQTVEVFGGRFSSELSEATVEQPPVHPRCRCTTGLVDT